MFDLQFQSYHKLNVFKVAESSTLGRFWVVFCPQLSPNAAPLFMEVHHKIRFAEITDNSIPLIYFSVEALRYNLEIPSYMSTAATKTLLK